MRPSHRSTALNAAITVMDAEGGGSITLDGVARAAGMTKAGLMYHFPTREALLLAIVDHAADRIEQAMLRSLGKPAADATPAEKIRAYAEVAADGSTSRAEYAIFTEAAYRPELSEPWTRRMAAWFQLPPSTDLDSRVRLQVARLAADGLWAAEATGVFPPGRTERDGVIALIQHLTTDSPQRPEGTS